MKLSSISHLVKEWHPTKNGELTPNDFTYGSRKKVWWLCPKGHSYESVIGGRTGGKRGCPYCAGKKVGEDNNLLHLFPEVAKEWHPTNNKELTPKQVFPKSHKKAWWLCPKGHSYNSVISSRTGKSARGCPYCSGNKVGEDNNLLIIFPEVAKEWHPTKNKELTPNQVTSGSQKKVWWMCSKGHSYESVIGGRTGRKIGCPYCSNKKVSEDNNLLHLFPEVAKEWHPTKNKELTPNQVTYGSGKKVWWLCPKNHSYGATISNRTNNRSACPYCSNKKVSEDNNLLHLFPEVAKEWHPTKNKELTPNQVISGSGKKVWWLCPKGHSYKSIVGSRAGKNKHGCPYCSNRKVSEDNNLLVVFPDIAKEWHPTKNKELTPNQVTSGSRKKVWWLCPKGHSYNSVISSRTGRKRGCPHCSNQSSEPEIRILSELKWFFDEVNSRYKIDGVEIDIFLPNYNLGIEYDGFHWHKDKEYKDLEKNKFILSQNITLIRVREYPLKSLSENDIVVKNDSLEKKDLDKLIKKIQPFVDNSIKAKNNTYFGKSSFVNEELFKEYRSYFPSPFPENSLLKTHPLISAEWDYDKNHPLRPENFSFGSHQKIWWLCPKGHSYSSAIHSRASKSARGCPYCSGNKVGEDNNLLIMFPEVAKEWHPTKNKELTPKQVSPGSHKKFWWLCPNNHSYESSIGSRTGKNKSGCPYCSGRKIGDDNNLLILFPEVAKEWHPTKNKELTPKQVSPGSHKKFWWMCSKGHSYESAPNSRTNKKHPTGCPFCSGRKTLNYDMFK